MDLRSSETPSPTILPQVPGVLPSLRQGKRWSLRRWHDSPRVGGCLVRAEVGWDAGYILFPSLLSGRQAFTQVWGWGFPQLGSGGRGRGALPSW